MSQEFGAHWTRKVETFFKRFDRDGDGELTEKDFRLIAENIVKVGKFTGKRAEEIRNKYDELWTRYFQPMAQLKPASCDAIIENFKKCGKAELKADLTEQLNLVFDVVDTNQDGSIQLDEFITYINIVGVNEAIGKKAFNALDTNHDGVLSRDEFVSAGVTFFILEEPSHPADLFYGGID